GSSKRPADDRRRARTSGRLVSTALSSGPRVARGFSPSTNGERFVKEKVKQTILPLTLIVALLFVWHMAVVGTGSAIFLTPALVVTGVLELLEDGTLWEHIAASLMRVAAGYLLAVCVAVPIGLWMGRVDAVYGTLNPVLQMLRPISPIAWIPLAILWFG